jgi:hypothetical protein
MTVICGSLEITHAGRLIAVKIDKKTSFGTALSVAVT